MTIKELSNVIYKPNFKGANIIIHTRCHEGDNTVFLTTFDKWFDDVDKVLMLSEVIFFKSIKKGFYEITAMYEA